MANPIPIIWSPTKNAFIKMGGSGGGGIIVPATEMTIRGSGGLYDEAVASYGNKGMYITGNGVTSAKFEEIVSGLYSMTIRTNWWNAGMDCHGLYVADNALFNITIYTINSSGVRTNVASSLVRHSDLAAYNGNQYGCDFGAVSLMFNYKNNVNETESLFAELSIPNQHAYHVRFDYLILNPVSAGHYSLPVVQS